ncbi:MAG: flagellar filament capping protein FliD [Gallionella sp.]|jgi:hypothetical protein|nr:flagellar filament capping protein FliD [Gallionella sp.]MCK9354180.1 flagellar filament capping protein FliD [Gallionella sp.]
MDSLSGINANSLLANIFASGVITPSTALRASSLSSGILFDNSSTVVELSGLGRALSAATQFQEHLLALKPGSATSGGGTNFGTDFASLAAEVQSFVDAFNGLQDTIADVGETNTLSGGNVSFAQGLSQSLDAQAQSDYANGSSALTNLSQLGITFQPATLPGGGGSLSIDLSELQSAFDTDAAGAFSLLSEAANAFGELGGSFAAQGARQYSSLATLAQFSSNMTLFGDGLFTPTQSSGNIGLFDNLLLAEALTSGANIQQTVRAISQYTLVANLFG